MSAAGYNLLLSSLLEMRRHELLRRKYRKCGLSTKLGPTQPYRWLILLPLAHQLKPCQQP